MEEEVTIRGTLSRKRAMSRRLLFLDVDTAAVTESVVVKEACAGVGGAADARHQLKLGDIVVVIGRRERAEADQPATVRADRIDVASSWKERSGGQQWEPAVTAYATDDTPQAAGEPEGGASQRVCHQWLNSGRCGRPQCPLRHTSTDVKAERAEWVAARLAARRERARAEADDLDDADAHATHSKQSRAPQFAAWLLATFGREMLSAGTGVVDVAGGRGDLSFELALAGVRTTLVDERREVGALDRRQRKRLRRAEAARAEARGAATPTEGAQDDADAAPAGASGWSRLPFAHVRRRFDAAFEEEHRETLASASMLIGMHPDQATEPIVDAALRHRVPFAVVPCCVFARELPKTLPSGEGVFTYNQLLTYLQGKPVDGTARRARLPIAGRNVIIYWQPPERECAECAADG